MNSVTVRTESIWSIGQDDTVTRHLNAEIRVDESYTFAHLDDTQGIIPVSKGLTERDFAVFLTFIGSKEGVDEPNTQMSVGYLVSNVDSAKDGSGTLVSGDALETSRSQYMSPEFLQRLLYLESIGVDLCGDFGLESLAAYINRKKA